MKVVGQFLTVMFVALVIYALPILMIGLGVILLIAYLFGKSDE